ncbi:MAG: flagellar basal body rod protein FlgB [Planctomycetaceae bacterium]
MLRMFQSTTIPALQQTLMFTEKRHELLASNIANLDTPDYQARDLPVDRFQSALADSIERSKNPSPGNVSGSRSSDLLGRPLQRDDLASGPRDAMEPIVFHDGSDVSMERQVTEIAKNQGLHNLAIATMRNQFAMLRAAITERA